MGLRADSARPQRISGSARTDSRRAESARNPIAPMLNSAMFQRLMRSRAPSRRRPLLTVFTYCVGLCLFCFHCYGHCNMGCNAGADRTRCLIR